MCTALVSALTEDSGAADVAMTGEITLRGEVLPIGGLKEKLLAAHRGGITTVLIPEENEKDLAEIPKNIKDKLDIVPVKWIDEVLQLALQNMPQPAGRRRRSRRQRSRPSVQATAPGETVQASRCTPTDTADGGNHSDEQERPDRCRGRAHRGSPSRMRRAPSRPCSARSPTR